jgi:hypothetical protein
MDIRYQSPPLPVDLRITSRSGLEDGNPSFIEKLSGVTEDAGDLNAVAALFDRKAE